MSGGELEKNNSEPQTLQYAKISNKIYVKM